MFLKYKLYKKIFLQLNLFFFLICCLAIHSCTYCIGPPCLIIIYRFSIWDTEQACWKCPICQQFWKVLQTAPFFFVTHSGTCSGRPCPPCPVDIVHHTQLHSIQMRGRCDPAHGSFPCASPSELLRRKRSFYKGRSSSTREEEDERDQWFAQFAVVLSQQNTV